MSTVTRLNDKDELTMQQSPHPDRGCDLTCDVTDDAHDGCVFFAPKPHDAAGDDPGMPITAAADEDGW